MNISRSFAWLPMLVILGLLAVGGGTYWYGQQESTPENSTSLQDSKTPVISALSATSAPADGHTEITIYGNGFLGGKAYLTAVIPPESEGMHLANVVNEGGANYDSDSTMRVVIPLVYEGLSGKYKLYIMVGSGYSNFVDFSIQ